MRERVRGSGGASDGASGGASKGLVGCAVT